MTDKNASPRLTLKDARILFRNFAGVERMYNSEGDRNFSVILDPERAERLREEGWRVKQLKPRDDEPGDYHLKVTVNYKSHTPPKCVLKTSTNTVELDEETVGILDAVEIERVDLVVNGWWSDMAGGGFGAFLKTIMITAKEDEIEQMINEVVADFQSPAGIVEDELDFDAMSEEEAA